MQKCDKILLRNQQRNLLKLYLSIYNLVYISVLSYLFTYGVTQKNDIISHVHIGLTPWSGEMILI